MKTLFYILLSACNTFLSQKVATILLYHDIGESDLHLTVSDERFREQMRFLHERNYNVISLRTLCRLLENGKQIPERTVVLTFDDGYLAHGAIVRDILEEYGFTGTFFVATECIGGSIGNSESKPQPVLHAEGLRALEASATADIEPHSVTHREFNDLTLDECKHEVLASKRELDQLLGKDSKFFAYPRGVYQREHARMLAKLGFLGAVTVDEGTVRSDGDRYTLPRNTIHSGTSRRLFALQTSAAADIFGAAKRVVRSVRSPK